jgi:hypothetical protein
MRLFSGAWVGNLKSQLDLFMKRSIMGEHEVITTDAEIEAAKTDNRRAEWSDH